MPLAMIQHGETMFTAGVDATGGAQGEAVHIFVRRPVREGHAAETHGIHLRIGAIEPGVFSGGPQLAFGIQQEAEEALAPQADLGAIDRLHAPGPGVPMQHPRRERAQIVGSIRRLRGRADHQARGGGNRLPSLGPGLGESAIRARVEDALPAAEDGPDDAIRQAVLRGVGPPEAAAQEAVEPLAADP